jgi:hypothetical protein
MLERSAGGDARTFGIPPGERVGAIGATDRPMALYTPGRPAVTYPRGSLWLVIGLLAILFTIFFGWVLFLR